MKSNKLKTTSILTKIISTARMKYEISRPTLFEKESSSRKGERKMKHLLGREMQEVPMGKLIGELQDRWQFPSDHLPIAITLDKNHILSWNVLDAAYMNWVIDVDSQGIKRSLIRDEHVYLEGSNLTVRDIHISEMIVQAFNHPTHPKSIVGLQECSQIFLEHLQTKIPENYVLIGGENAVLIDTNKFEIVNKRKVFGIFSKDKRPINEILLENNETGDRLRVLNAHLPGDPNGPARFEFCQYLRKSHLSELITVALGDMNFNELEMVDAMKKTGTTFTIISPYCTNISIRSSEIPFVSKAIDHFIILGDVGERVSAIKDPEAAMQGLQKPYDLLMP